ncbi:hypothetical protein [Variovorax ginsengisoli]|uniref:Uncharacterized protein n=1 Tax=Variovorax ginsengisoli TaxID=363844 RepID=A0ABT8RZT9_9BURK|nr:hypothetical protein [Variovorax ginsengisoli]MDN8612805.1 hypothetical protein [Variovorax ginsengisoli]MDO1531975.1 hypothetical protein [Variovorax ginsengisoli]
MARTFLAIVGAGVPGAFFNYPIGLTGGGSCIGTAIDPLAACGRLVGQPDVKPMELKSVAGLLVCWPMPMGGAD